MATVQTLLYFCSSVHMAAVIPPQRRVDRVVTCFSSKGSKPSAQGLYVICPPPPRSEKKITYTTLIPSGCVYVHGLQPAISVHNSSSSKL